MDRETFAERLAAAAAAAVQCARVHLIEDLPASLAFRVRLNQSYDGLPAQPSEIRFPEDSSSDRATALHRCDFETVVGELWRQGHVPQWVNLAVVGASHLATIIEVVCCGRFTADEGQLYNMPGGTAPFHAVGPVLPPAHDGTRFSIHARSECWDREDLDMLTAAPDRVWSLRIETDEFDHRMLDAVPDLPNVEIIEHAACTLAGEALAAFARFPKLRVLRLHLSKADRFHLGGSRLSALTNLVIENLPNRSWAHDLRDSAPGLTSLDLRGRDTVRFDGSFPESFRHLSITAPRIAGATRSPLRVDHLDLHLADSTDRDVLSLLHAITPVETLSLRGTPVTDSILPSLEGFHLEGIDLVGTLVSAAALNDYRDRHPESRLYPQPPAPTTESIRAASRWSGQQIQLARPYNASDAVE
ncbi:hypothetical protein ACFYTS_36080 [Nocardia sp. NPDC004151]|uniref:hypothetical protein n=1 Tax=Nocardia sp. NPDC004151 TaxID=3364304 RepID=UPI0036A441F0